MSSKRKPRKLPNPELLRELLEYDPETGSLIWRRRDRRFFDSDGACNAWNKSFASTPALNTRAPQGYRHGRLFGKPHKAHRVVYAIHHGVDPADRQVDHINGDTGDNRIENLRLVTVSQNQQNARLRVDNTSGTPGVHWAQGVKRWIAVIKVKGKKYHLGNFVSKADAIAARKNGERKHGFHPNHGRTP